MIQKLKPDILLSIKNDQELQLKIAKAFKKKNIVTVQRWVKSNNPLLSLDGVQKIIRKHMGLSDDAELIEQESQPEKAKAIA